MVVAVEKDSRNETTYINTDNFTFTLGAVTMSGFFIKVKVHTCEFK